MDIQDLRIFARVAALQNLSAVGSEFGLTPGTISKRLQALESDLGVRLFDRTTRSIRITEEGVMFLRHAERILVELERARASVGENAARPVGQLKIAAPASLTRLFVAPSISDFMRAYPDIGVHIDLIDRPVNLQDDGYDVAIRAGVLTSSTLKAKRLAPDPQVVVASPAYLERNGDPASPADLVHHNCFVLGGNWQWTFAKGERRTAVRIDGRLRSNNGDLLRHAALDGHGIAQISEMRVREDLEKGRLARVLRDYEVVADSAVWAIYPDSKFMLPKLRVLLDFLGEWFRTRGARQGEEPRARHAGPAADARIATNAAASAREAPISSISINGPPARP